MGVDIFSREGTIFGVVRPHRKTSSLLRCTRQKDKRHDMLRCDLLSKYFDHLFNFSFLSESGCVHFVPAHTDSGTTYYSVQNSSTHNQKWKFSNAVTNMRTDEHTGSEQYLGILAMNTSTSILLSVGPKCTLAASHAAPGESRWVCAARFIKIIEQRETDRRTTDLIINETQHREAVIFICFLVSVWGYVLMKTHSSAYGTVPFRITLSFFFRFFGYVFWIKLNVLKSVSSVNVSTVRRRSTAICWTTTDMSCCRRLQVRYCKMLIL